MSFAAARILSLTAGLTLFVWAAMIGLPASAQEGVAGRLEDLAVTPPAPALNLVDLSGHLHETPAYRGKVIVVAFWATWCGPCRKEMPALQRLRARHDTDQVAVLAVNYGETEPKIERFLDKIGVANLTVLLDRNEEAARRWFVGNLPLAYAVGPDGIVRLGKKGEVDWDSPTIDAQLRDLARSETGKASDQ
ncbi:MAG: TlpA disulfide reductase family protein [Pseudomonadota bacterium]